MKAGFLTTEKLKSALNDALLTACILAAATALCYALSFFWSAENYVSMIYVLAVFLVARLTSGYLWGIAASLVSVLATNYAFTYPYFHFNFTLAGYPVAVLSMLAVSLATSALTTKAKSSERIRIEAEREKTRANLLRAVSHDLRTPLTSIYGSTSAIIENDDTISKQQRLSLLGEVRDDAQWLIRMVENLLTITRIDDETGARIIKRGEAAEEVVSAAVDKFKKNFPTHSVSVSVPDELLIVPMDGVLIEQVILNLLENAALHSKSTQPFLLRVTSDGERACFSVTDSGRGIAPEVLPRVFEGYPKEPDEGSADSKRSMGIGLSVCKTIIEAHNGTTSAKNLKEGGAQFSFTLPLK